MACVLAVILVATLGLHCQAVPESVILDETFADVVELPSLKREDGERKYKLQAFGQEIDLDLFRTKDLLPATLPVHVYGEDDEGNPTVDDWTHNTDTFQTFYTDKQRGASLMIEDVDGETKLTGMLGKDMIIEPVTDILLPEDDSTEKREISRLRHIVYKVKPQTEETTTDDYELAEDDEEEVNSEKRATPSRIYVPVQVVVDYALWKKLARTEAKVITYLKIFYNSVNLLYSTITYPSVSVSIHGITICKVASACPMVENYRTGTDGVNAKTSLAAIARYAYQQKDITGTDYAVMIVLTDYDMCSPKSSGTCERSTAGLAYVGTACGAYYRSKSSKTGLAEDHGAYDGIKTVAHEIGHVLGMNHDGDGPVSTGAPGARSCSWSDNNIMGQTEFTTNQYIWSSCSVNQLRWLAGQSKASCLSKNPGYSKYGLINRLPGKEVSLDNQCRVLYGSSSSVGCRLPGINSGNDQLCLGLMCKTSTRGCSSKTPPAEGSYCGPQRYCQKGRCICDPSAPLPTAPARSASCQGDTPRIRINGQECVNLLTSSNGLSNCESSLVKTHCCESRYKYCRATPISCSGGSNKPPVTIKPYVPPKTTPKAAAPVQSKDHCGRSCSDTPNLRINQQTCTALLSTSSKKLQYCDNPTVVTHCCKSRASVCSGYHTITLSCDDSCQDNPSMKINGKKCIEFLKTSTDQRYYCRASITKQHCCATQRVVCSNSVVATAATTTSAITLAAATIVGAAGVLLQWSVERT